VLGCFGLIGRLIGIFGGRGWPWTPETTAAAHPCLAPGLSDLARDAGPALVTIDAAGGVLAGFDAEMPDTARGISTCAMPTGCPVKGPGVADLDLSVRMDQPTPGFEVPGELLVLPSPESLTLVQAGFKVI